MMTRSEQDGGSCHLGFDRGPDKWSRAVATAHEHRELDGRHHRQRHGRGAINRGPINRDVIDRDVTDRDLVNDADAEWLSPRQAL
jgi:hypothetical protein